MPSFDDFLELENKKDASENFIDWEAQIPEMPTERKGLEAIASEDGLDAHLSGFEGNSFTDGYERQIPGHFSDEDGESVDHFTKNVLENYATEGLTEDHHPNGVFTIKKNQAEHLA